MGKKKSQGRTGTGAKFIGGLLFTFSTTFAWYLMLYFFPKGLPLWFLVSGLLLTSVGAYFALTWRRGAPLSSDVVHDPIPTLGVVNIADMLALVAWGIYLSLVLYSLGFLLAYVVSGFDIEAAREFISIASDMLRSPD